ncbi:MAG: type II toxin-antitoxin system HipA family toxin [Chitinophagales bacterium]
MAKRMDVYLHDVLAGHLDQDDDGLLSYTYDEHYITQPGVLALSQSLPLRKETYSAKECRGFFSGILPEGEKREIIARNLGISARNDFSMLEQIGGECAGAVTFMPEGHSIHEQDSQYRTVSNDQLVKILKELPRRPLLAGEDNIRLSLAGAQDKLAIHLSENIISLPLGNAPSTHIIKPAIERFEGIVFNEALCMHLATILGLDAARVEARSIDSIDYLLIERYDRTAFLQTGDNAKNSTLKKRLHQEDFCQALGIVSERKYQHEGGPSLKDCFRLLRETSSAPLLDLQKLLDAVIFNFLIGNHDAHGKNFSLIYNWDNKSDEVNVRLAPLYDVVCTTYYPDLSKNMAMAIGGKYKSESILPAHFEKFAEDAGLSKPLVKKRVLELAGGVMDHLNEALYNLPKAEKVAEKIRRQVEQTIKEFKE